jgi:hypothetical protein
MHGVVYVICVELRSIGQISWIVYPDVFCAPLIGHQALACREVLALTEVRMIGVLSSRPTAPAIIVT